MSGLISFATHFFLNDTEKTKASGSLTTSDGSKKVSQRIGPRNQDGRIVIGLGGCGSSNFILLLLGLGLLAAGFSTGSYAMFVTGCVLTCVFGLPLIITIACIPCIVLAKVLQD